MVKMTKPPQFKFEAFIQKLTENTIDFSEPTLNPFRGNLQIFANNDQDFKNFIDGMTVLLQQYLASYVYDDQPQVCQTCGSQDIVRNGTKDKTFQDVIGTYDIKVQRYICNECSRTTSLDDNSVDTLAFKFSGTSISISRLATILYNGGCSLRYTSDIILASTGVSLKKDAIRRHILKFGGRIRTEYSSDLDRKKAKQVAIDEQYFTIRSRDPNNQSLMVITVVDVEKDKIVQMRTEKAKQITELDVKFILDEFEEDPEVIVTDGARAYKSGIKEFAPGSYHENCLQHRCHNVRKKKQAKKIVKSNAESIVGKERQYHHEQLKRTYKREVLKELTKLLENRTIGRKTAWQEVSLANEAIDEKLDLLGYSEEKMELRQKIHEAYLHRRLYAAMEAAEYARLKELGLEEVIDQRTTAKVEGYHRTVRSRERRALCYRTVEFAQAVAQINAEFYNYKRGHGIKESPFEGFRLKKQIKAYENVNRHITIRSEKYKQQRSYSLQNATSNQVMLGAMQSVAIA